MTPRRPPAPTCPLCGTVVYRTHTCRASALVETSVPPVDVTAPAPRRRQLRPVDECPEHPGAGQPHWACELCALDAVPAPLDWRIRGGGN